MPPVCCANSIKGMRQDSRHFLDATGGAKGL